MNHYVCWGLSDDLKVGLCDRTARLVAERLLFIQRHVIKESSSNRDEDRERLRLRKKMQRAQRSKRRRDDEDLKGITEGDCVVLMAKHRRIEEQDSCGLIVESQAQARIRRVHERVRARLKLKEPKSEFE